MELCWIVPGQRVRKLDERQVSIHLVSALSWRSISAAINVVITRWLPEVTLVICAAQTAEMIKTAAQKPPERKNYISRCLQDYADLPNNPSVRAFKMSVDTRMIEVKTCHIIRSSYSCQNDACLQQPALLTCIRAGSTAIMTTVSNTCI